MFLNYISFLGVFVLVGLSALEVCTKSDLNSGLGDIMKDVPFLVHDVSNNMAYA